MSEVCDQPGGHFFHVIFCGEGIVQGFFIQYPDHNLHCFMPLLKRKLFNRNQRRIGSIACDWQVGVAYKNDILVYLYALLKSVLYGIHVHIIIKSYDRIRRLF